MALTEVSAFKDGTIKESDLDITNAGSDGQFLKKAGTQFTWDTVIGGATGVDFNDDVEVRWGTGDDFIIKHTANESYIHNKTGDLNIVVWDSTASAWDEAIVVKADSAGVDIKHNAATKLATSATGVTVTGTVAATAYTGDGSALTGLQAGATGGNSGANAVFWENQQKVTHDYTITNERNAGSWGPVTIEDGVTVTIGDGEYWTIM